MNYPVRCRICHRLIGWYSEPIMATCKECNEAEAQRSRETWKKAHEAADAEKAKPTKPKCSTCKDTGTVPIETGDEYGTARLEPEHVVVRDLLLETLRGIPDDLIVHNLPGDTAYQTCRLGIVCRDAAARVEALELELKAAQANQCDGGGSVEFQGILASNGQPVTLCRKCNKWRARPCA